jgi:ABC-type nickel/cobalt efflux system permease component RcnA
MDIASILLIATGFVLGLAHSIDPDHIVAVSTLLCNTNSLRKSIFSATAWGAGHSAMLLLVGLLFLVLRVELPLSIVNIFEFSAGVMLIILGIFVVKPILSKKENTRFGKAKHYSSHSHVGNDGKIHSHTHNHSHSHGSSHLHKSILTGVLQGLAGSAALMLVTLTTVSSFGIGLVFILVFGAGVILGMIGVACLIGSLLKLTESRLENIHEKIKLITGLISIVFGAYIAIQVALTFHF